jgi:hypothetical protein
LNEIDSQLAEIDENLIRNELKVLERGEQLERRKRLYEVKFPQTVKGKAQARGSNKKQGHNVSAESALTFIADTAQKTSQSKRAVETDVQIAKNLPKQVRDAIRDTPAADHKDGLLKLARLPKLTPTLAQN